ncbi:OmpA family protein [Novosphingobium rosa]|uniref:OmpA family protein n=1 Tax=Novosphingobium rosa TaxID=76978 RepID=UPI001470A888|nr:OmpA family protein [Novosphingobium rosa]
MIVAAPAAARPAKASEPSVQGYLCVFAGKCDGALPDAPGGDPVTTDDSGVTEGFRIARPDPGGKKVANAISATQTAAPSQGFVGKSAHGVVRPSHVGAARSALAASSAQPVAGAGHADLMIGFKLNSAQITPDGMVKARVFAQAMQMPELSGKRFLIEGHTDSRGKLNANMDLSQRRAQAVADFLAQQGVEASRIDVRGFGPSQPLPGHVASDTRNRRVEARLAS